MINISQDTLNALQTPVKLRESVKLTSSLISFAKEIKKVELNKEGMINRSNLSQLKVTLHGEHDLQGQYFNFERSFTTLDDVIHTIPYGQYRVIKQEYKDNDKTTDLELYDNMIKTQVEYKKEDINVTFPITLLNMFKKVASTVGLQTDVTTFPLSNETIKLDVWSNTSYTYRDVLDHIAEISGNTIYIKDNKLFITGGQTTGVTIDYKRSKALKVSEKVGKFNLLNLTREPQHDNYAYPTNWASIPIDDRKEYVIQNNAIIDNDREVWASKIFNNIKDLEYTPFEADTFGWGIFDIGDKVTVKDLNGKTYQSIITSEINSYNGMWTTKLESKKLSNAKDKYVVITDQRRQGQTVYFLVDQQNGVIEGVINNVTQLGETTTQLRLDLENILLKVESTGNSNIIYNLNGNYDINGWTFVGESSMKFKERLRFYEGMKWNSSFVPSEEKSVSGFKFTWVNNNWALTSKGRVLGGQKYSYRGVRVGDESRYKVYLREYKTMNSEEDVNLIKNDFSDFNAYAGAIPSVNKTYPIDTFKGGKNLLLNTKINDKPVGVGYIDFPLTNISSGSYTLNVDWEINGEVADKNFLILILNTNGNREVYPELSDKSIVIDLLEGDTDIAIYAQMGFVSSSSVEAKLKEVKLVEGVSLNEPYAPAPEDGYNYTGLDGGYHIQIKGGTSELKFLREFGFLDGTYTSYVRAFSFNDNLLVSMNGVAKVNEIPKGKVTDSIIFDENETGLRHFNFTSTGISNDLDFIASNPAMYTGFTESLLLDTIDPKTIETASIVLKEDTVAVRLRFLGKKGLALTDQMFNRGEPREWELSAEDVKVWAESQILIRDNTIALQAQEIDNLNNDIHNAGVEINAVDGITTWGSVLNFMNSSKTKSLLKIVTKEGEEHLEIDLSNSSVGNFTMDNGAMVLTTPPYERMYEESDLSVIKDIIETQRTPTSYELHLYDLNRSGNISLIDYSMVKSHLMNVTPITVFPIIQSRIIVGNNNGEFLAQALFDNGNVGAQTKIRDNRVETSNLSVDGISFGGKSVEVDNNGFLKVV